MKSPRAARREGTGRRSGALSQMRSRSVRTTRRVDPDAIVHALEGDPAAAEEAIREQIEPKPLALPDWPDILAHDLSKDPALSLGEWADRHGLSAGSVSRGFGQVYGVTPAAYRLLQRTHRAIRAILGSEAPLAALAQNCGFADRRTWSDPSGGRRD